MIILKDDNVQGLQRNAQGAEIKMERGREIRLDGSVGI